MKATIHLGALATANSKANDATHTFDQDLLQQDRRKEAPEQENDGLLVFRRYAQQ